jgi:uncharacterized protein
MSFLQTRRIPFLHVGGTMKPRITLLTLCVDDLERAVQFYQTVGWKTEGIVGKQFEHGAVAFFDLERGLKLALWPRQSLSHDSGLPVDRKSSTDFTLAHNVASREEVDEVMREVEAAGGRIVKRPADTFYGGYAGYFQDPDGHTWEAAWNPKLVP